MKQVLLLITLVVASLWTRAASAVPVVEDKEKGILINVGALVQPTFQMTMPGTSSGNQGACPGDRRCSAGIGSPNGTASYDFFLRRARIMVWGSATKEISFFVDTDEPNLGKPVAAGGSNFGTFSFIQDAFLTYSFNPMLRIDMGLMLVPLSHHTLEGATSLNALDYHSDMIRFPAGRIFRDVGIQVRGVALADHLHYRLGLFEGVRNNAVTTGALPANPVFPTPNTKPTLNPGGVPRLTAQVRGNILGVEPDFFFKGIYFSATPIISVGAGIDYQPKSVMKRNTPDSGPVPGAGNYLAASGDAFVEYPFNADNELIFKGNYFYWNEGTTNVASVAAINANVYGASSFYAEAGYRWKWVEPVVFVEDLMGRKDSIDILALNGGVNFWIMKHNMNIKTAFTSKTTSRKKTNEATLKDMIWTTQAQLFF